MLFYILSLSRLGSILRGLACYSISYHTLAVSAEAWHPYHALAVSAEAWHAILYLITAWQYPYHTLAASAEAWHAILYLITP